MAGNYNIGRKLRSFVESFRGSATCFAGSAEAEKQAQDASKISPVPRSKWQMLQSLAECFKEFVEALKHLGHASKNSLKLRTIWQML
jgi:hypothetical protein